MDCGAPMLHTWQHEETGRICELPDGKNPGARWYLVTTPNGALTGQQKPEKGKAVNFIRPT